MKKRIVQLQIGAAAIAAILGTGSVINAFPCSAALVTAYAKEQNTEENVTVVNEKTTFDKITPAEIYRGNLVTYP